MLSLRIKIGAMALTAGIILGGILPVQGIGYAAEKVSTDSIHPVRANHSSANIGSQITNTKNTKVILKANGVLTGHEGLWIEGKTWVPITFLRDGLGLPLSYNKESRTYSIGQEYRQLSIAVSEYGEAVDMNGFYLKDSGRTIDGHLYIPFQVVKNYLGYQGDWSAAAKKLNVLSVKENPLKINIKTYDREADHASIHLKYPEVTAIANEQVEKAINQVLESDAEQFKEEIEKNLRERSDDPQSPNRISPDYQYSSSFVITYNKDGFLSMLTQQNVYTGGAHGMPYRKAYTFSLSDGSLMSLEDLFGQGEHNFTSLNEQIKADFQKLPDYYGGFVELGSQPDFYLQQGEEALKVFFQVYEYTPYAAGFPEFPFPLKVIFPNKTAYLTI
ncbi:MAG TPA: DUF4163 domain-containing protein [Paenibacillus sp.]